MGLFGFVGHIYKISIYFTHTHTQTDREKERKGEKKEKMNTAVTRKRTQNLLFKRESKQLLAREFKPNILSHLRFSFVSFCFV